MSTNKKITRDNYQSIKRFSDANGIDATCARFGISRATVCNIRKEPDYSSYLSLLAKYSYKAKSNEKQANKVVNKPKELSSPFVDVKPAYAKSKTSTIKSDSLFNKVNVPKRGKEADPNNRRLSNENLIKACEILEKGGTNVDVSKAIGISVKKIEYILRNNAEQKARIREARIKGEPVRLQKQRDNLARARAKKAAITNQNSTTVVKVISKEQPKENVCVKNITTDKCKCDGKCAKAPEKKTAKSAEDKYTSSLSFLFRCFGIATLILALALAIATIK